jgi:hypothetical protein
MLAAGEDTNAIARVLGRLAKRFVETESYEDADTCIRGLIELATTAHQITPGGVTNHFAEPVAMLAIVEREAEEQNADATATLALAGWLLAVAYTDFHFGIGKHSLWDRSIHEFGPAPPWQAAREMVQSDQWQRTWANKQYRGSGPVLKAATRAKRDHDQRGH